MFVRYRTGVLIFDQPIPNTTYNVTLIATDAEIQNVGTHDMELLSRWCY
jgi:hypothetical protein